VLLLGSAVQEPGPQDQVGEVVVGAGLEEERRVAAGDQAVGEVRLMDQNHKAMLVMMLMALSCTIMLFLFYMWLQYTEEQDRRRVDKIIGRDPEEYQPNSWDS
jgi:hypothetical protein